MAANKTVETDADLGTFVTSIADDGQRADTDVLIASMAQVSGEPAKMWGSSIIGFGSYHYRYESGREGDSLRMGFSPRKGKLVLYGLGSQIEKLDGLGKHSTGKGCINIKRLSDIDLAVFERVIAAGWASSLDRNACR